MKKFLLITAAAILSANAAVSEDRVVTLDLTKANMQFDAETGAWTETYNDDETSIDAQCFSFVHGSLVEMGSWWGFTASNSADNSRKDNTIKFQFSNMAMGGIVLNEDGTVKKDESGSVVTDATVPYLVAYYGAYFAARPVDMTFTDTNKSYEPIGVYLNSNSYPYYSIEIGDSFSRAFHNGDKFTVTIHGVAADESEKTIDVNLASYDNGDLTINRGWKYVDLSSLGKVNELYFTMSSTDTGAYGMNTPAYFCMDKLSVKESDAMGINDLNADKTGISYDSDSKTITVTGAEFAMVCDIAGNTLMSGDSGQFNISHLPAGIYIVKAGNSRIKIAK